MSAASAWNSGARRFRPPAMFSRGATAAAQPEADPAVRTTPRRPGLRVIPGGASRAPRAPFVVLVLTVLGVGLVGLLLLNSALQKGSFEIRDLEREAQALRAEQAALLHELAGQSAPDVLVDRARALGMAPAGDRAWLDLSGGSISSGSR